MPGSDNPRPDPARLFGVAQGEAWEREVRESLADQAAGVRPSGADLAGTAIARGRRQRRLRGAAGLAAVLVAMVIATGALLFDWRGSTGTEFGPVTGLLGDPVTSSPTPSDEPARLAYDRQLAADLSVDLVGDGANEGVVLATGDGETLDLGPIREVVSAHRVGEGWAVVSGGPVTSRLWWVTAEGAPVSVLAGMDAVVVSQGRVAWQRGAVLSTATLTGDGELHGRVTTTAPQDAARPIGFLGEAVLLERADPQGWDTWDPAGGDYQPGWTRGVVQVYGELAGQDAVGLARPAGSGTGHPCLARLDRERELAVAQTSCEAGELSVDGPASVSPQGRWLMATADESGKDRDGDRTPVLVDLAAAFEQDPAAVIEVGEVAAPASQPVWLGSGTVLFLTADKVVKLWPERLRAGAEDAIELADRSGATLLVVEPV